MDLSLSQYNKAFWLHGAKFSLRSWILHPFYGTHKFIYWARKSLQLVPTISQMNPVHTLPPNFSMIHFNIMPLLCRLQSLLTEHKIRKCPIHKWYDVQLLFTNHNVQCNVTLSTNFKFCYITNKSTLMDWSGPTVWLNTKILAQALKHFKPAPFFWLSYFKRFLGHIQETYLHRKNKRQSYPCCKVPVIHEDLRV
jgi:hypothetical protein